MDSFQVTTMDKSILTTYSDLTIMENTCLLEYVWIDHSGMRLQTKRLEVDKVPNSPEECAVNSFSEFGSEKEAFLQPVRLYQDPFEGAPHKLVLCSTLDHKGCPAEANHRSECLKAMELARSERPWFTFEQEYYIIDPSTNKPLGWPEHGNPPAMGPNYCGVGGGKENGREIVRAHYRACRYAGVKLSGFNGEWSWGQWEYQCGISEGIKAADDLWISRYILERIAAEFGYGISFEPKPLIPTVNGCGLHCNFSTESSRNSLGPGKAGLITIHEYIRKLEINHMKHIRVYDANRGEDNKSRLSGNFMDTIRYDRFDSGVARRNVSIRIRKTTNDDGYGYFEDRRPASNADPYLVCEAMVRTCILE